jgi:hypothetical protein
MKRLFVLFILASSLVPHSGLAGIFGEEFGANERNIGINLFASQLDYCEDRLFADAMKTAREFTKPKTGGQGAAVSVDSNGWPLADCDVIVSNGLNNWNGTYHLEGYSSFSPTIISGFSEASIQNFAYSNGKFSADIVCSSTNNLGLLLTFLNTGGGVRNVKLMRPITVGSTKSYATSVTFTDQAKNMVKKFNVIRFMWSVDGWNGPWQVNWSDRVSPTYCSFNRGSGTTNVGWAGKGMAWEYAIRFCNETGKDLWLNMPIGATDDYILNLANLVNKIYAVPDGKVYWEYSNEATWDGKKCAAYLRATGLADKTVGYDGVTDANIISARYYAKRTAEMSVIWRGVWGDAAMMTKIRPIASGQLKYDAELIWGLDFINNWFNNGDGILVSDPHPPKYYLYGCGGSHYTGDNPDQLTNGVSEISTFESYEEEETCIAKMYGLKRCAYEGGVWTSAVNYQLPRIKDAMIRYQQLWEKYDGDLLSYYVTTGGEDGGAALGFTQNIFNLNTQKFNAYDDILNTTKKSATAGKVAPCVIEGADYSMNSTVWEHPAPGGAETFGGAQLDQRRTHKGYLVRVTEAGNYSISLNFANTTGAIVEIMVDGSIIAKETMSGSKSIKYIVALSKGLHGIRIRKYDNGEFILKSIELRK